MHLTLSTPKTQIVSVLFLDIIGYSKRAVSDQVEIKRIFNTRLSHALEPVGGADRIVLDTGDGAAVAFLQHPEDALLTSDRLMAALFGEDGSGETLFGLRSGIHFGPAVIVHDVNGFGNLVGDGINDAQRIMSFAGDNEVLASRYYADMVARISEKFAARFVPAGTMQDKHGKAHDVSRVLPSGYALPAPTSPSTTPVGTSASFPKNGAPARSRSRSFAWAAVVVAILFGVGGWSALQSVSSTTSTERHPTPADATVTGKTSSAELASPAVATVLPSPRNTAVAVQPPASAVTQKVPAKRAPPPSTGIALPTPVMSKDDSPCPQCNCSDLLTKTSLGITLTATELRFMQSQCR